MKEDNPGPTYNKDVCICVHFRLQLWGPLRKLEMTPDKVVYEHVATPCGIYRVHICGSFGVRAFRVACM